MATTLMLDSALEYAAAGLPVVPLHGIRDNGTCTCGRPDCSSPGKHPRTRNGLKDATTKVATIRKWWGQAQWPNASIAGVGGEFLCLDVDSKSKGKKSLETLIKDNSPLPDTAVVLTGEYDGERGLHYWFRVPDDRQVASKIGIRKGLDIRCSRGYAVLPPSPHASGVEYEWVTPFEEVAGAPEWLLDLIPEAVAGTSTWSPNPKFRMSREVRDFLSGNLEIEPGEQRDFLVRAARSVLTTGKTVDEAADLLYEGNDGEGGICASPASREPWTHEEILYLVEDVFRKPPTSEMQKSFADEGYTWDDWGNAQRLVDAFEDKKLFHVHEWGKWYIWDEEEMRWIEDDGTRIRRTWESVTKKLWDESFGTDDKNWIRFVNKCRNRAATENASFFARDYVRQTPNDLNSEPFLLNCRNGILDLRAGTLLDSTPDHLLTKQIRADYDPKAKSQLFRKVLDDLVPDKDLQLFLQKIFGYALTGSTEEHKFFYFHGPPGAGKTTLLEAFAYLMGNYSESAEPSTFMLQQTGGAGPTEDIARLSAARMVVTHEVEENARWAEAKIAHLTGGDKVTARFLHQNSFEFYPKFKLFFSANHKPRVSGSSNSGLWRRLIIVPIERVIPENERDPMLLRKLRQEEHLNAMLSWAVEGAQLWMKDYQAGRLMEVPQVVKDEVDEYRMESDHVLQFISDTLTKTENERDRIPKPDLYQIYRAWCEVNGRRQYNTANKFTRELQAAGYTWKAAQHEGKVRDCWTCVQTKGLPKIKSKDD